MKKNVFIVVLIIIILGMGGYLVYDKKLSKDESKQEKTSEKVVKEEERVNEDKVYTFNDVTGFYTFSEPVPNNEGQQFKFSYSIYLWGNGTFNYRFTMNAGSHVLGNYTIVNDEIHLNYLFEGGNDAGITATTGEKLLKIVDKDHLQDNDGYYVNSGGSKVINLTRDTNRTDNFDEYNVSEIINNYAIFNNENKNNF